MTTVQIEIPDQQAAALRASAQARGLTVEQYLVQLVEQSAPIAELSLRAFSEMSADEKARDFEQWAKSHRYTPPLSDEAISRAEMYPDRR